jgi:hypothetical protein
MHRETNIQCVYGITGHEAQYVTTKTAGVEAASEAYNKTATLATLSFV